MSQLYTVKAGAETWNRSTKNGAITLAHTVAAKLRVVEVSVLEGGVVILELSACEVCGQVYQCADGCTIFDGTWG